MTTDLDTLAARLVDDVDEVKTCLILSETGAVLGAAPPEGVAGGRAVWERFRALGSPERGFAVVGGEVWTLVVRGGRAGLVVAAASAAPGLLLDRLEVMLQTAGDVMGVEPVPAPVGAAPAGEMFVAEPVAPPPRAEPAPNREPEPNPEPNPEPAKVAVAPKPDPVQEPGDTAPMPETPRSADPDVDTVALTREFAFLMDEGPPRGES